MRSIRVAIIVAVLSVCSAATALASSQKPDKPLTSDRLLPLKPTRTGNSCAAYGSGFVKIDGTDTCVQVGGAIRIGVSSSSRVR
jgi:hypothetical protein